MRNIDFLKDFILWQDFHSDIYPKSGDIGRAYIAFWKIKGKDKCEIGIFCVPVSLFDESTKKIKEIAKKDAIKKVFEDFKREIKSKRFKDVIAIAPVQNVPKEFRKQIDFVK